MRSDFLPADDLEHHLNLNFKKRGFRVCEPYYLFKTPKGLKEIALMWGYTSKRRNKVLLPHITVSRNNQIRDDDSGNFKFISMEVCFKVNTKKISYKFLTELFQEYPPRSDRSLDTKTPFSKLYPHRILLGCVCDIPWNWSKFEQKDEVFSGINIFRVYGCEFEKKHNSSLHLLTKDIASMASFTVDYVSNSFNSVRRENRYRLS